MPLLDQPSPHPLITEAEWSGVIYQVNPQDIFPFWDARSDKGFCLGVSHHRMLLLYQHCEFQRHKSYEIPSSRSFEYPHGGQRQPIFTSIRVHTLCPISVKPSLQWKLLTILSRTHVFWVCWWLQLVCEQSRTATPTPCSRYYARKIQAPPILQPYNLPTVKKSLQSLHITRGFLRSRSRRHCNVSLNSSLDRSVPSQDLGTTVRYPHPSEACSRFCCILLPTA